MVFSLFIRPLALVLSLVLLLPSSLVDGSAGSNSNPILTYHAGPLLTGNINLAIIWYGNVGRSQKLAIRNFIKSLNLNSIDADVQPQVSTWWKVVESYQGAVPGSGGSSPPIRVRAYKQMSDTSYQYGKILTVDYLPQLVEQVTKGDPNLLPVILTARDITVQGLCMGKCGLHALIDGKKPCIVVGNPETECPGACAWPFHKSDMGPQGVVLQPPNGNIGADAMVVAFASALAEVVTNPFNSGFYQGRETDPVGAAMACRGIFGSGAFPGNAGKVRIDPKTGGAFNAHGNKNKKFLLPAIWDPRTSTCWTLM
ncbi:hypothetical protein SLE2022_127720 [Rubroshorea leprosula]